MKDEVIFYYVMDPMCSWCWAFKPTIQKIFSLLPSHVKVETLMGGLAPDDDKPMLEEMQKKIKGIWEQIEKTVPGTQFNYDFWEKNTPIRSTYMACRAVIIAGSFSEEKKNLMIKEIQENHYLNARNPSLKEELAQFAENIGIDKKEFLNLLTSDITEKLLQNNINISRTFQVTSFPSLRLLFDETVYEIPYDYNDYQVTIQAIAPILVNNTN